jgi:hypothetical protein
MPTPKDQLIHILGVWFNAYRFRSFVVNQAMDKIKNVYSIITKKRITDNHIKYIFNHVIIPRIEYRTQTIV